MRAALRLGRLPAQIFVLVLVLVLVLDFPGFDYENEDDDEDDGVAAFPIRVHPSRIAGSVVK